MQLSRLLTGALLAAMVPLQAMQVKVSTDYTGDITGLFDGKSSEGVNFKAGEEAPEWVEFVIILDKPEKLDHVELVSRSANKWWNISSYQLLAASAAGRGFEEIQKTDWYNRGEDDSRKTFTRKIPLNGWEIKRLVLIIQRPHRDTYMNLSRIKLVDVNGKAISEKATPVPYVAETPKAKYYNDNVSRPVVDRYGQFIHDSWQGKVTSDRQLQDEYRKEAEALKNVRPDTEKYDQYGGVKQYQLEATGLFRVEQWRGRWWFVTPEGHPYVMNGPGAVNPDQWGYSTPLYRTGENKEKISRKHLFEELPDQSKFPGSYISYPGYADEGVKVNFLLTNIFRKYGMDYEKKFAEMTYRRLLAWGFNCYGKWTDPAMFFKYGYKLPYIGGLKAGAKPRIEWAVDPFHPELPQEIKTGVAAAYQRDKDNPWLIGYFFWSESGWNRDIVKCLIENDKYTASPAAAEFRKFLLGKLKEKYGDDMAQYRSALELPLENVSQITDSAHKLKWTAFMDSIAGDFIRYAGKVFFGMVRREYDKAGNKHLLLGSAMVPRWHNDIEWSEGGAEFLDVVSVDYYGHNKEEVLRYARATNRPVINIEFNFSTEGRGLRNFPGGFVKTRGEQGFAYSRMVENCVADESVIGFNPFVLYDQPVTGRSCSAQGTWGESYNTGFINGADQPYADYLKTVTETNKKLFDIHLGTVKPVEYTEWKYRNTGWYN